jgi:hypothetical protein
MGLPPWASVAAWTTSRAGSLPEFAYRTGTRAVVEA